MAPPIDRKRPATRADLDRAPEPMVGEIAA
jgi:hypothetical protein